MSSNETNEANDADAQAAAQEAEAPWPADAVSLEGFPADYAVPRRTGRRGDRDETMVATTFFLGMVTPLVAFAIACGVGGRSPWVALIAMAGLGVACLIKHRARPYGAGVVAMVALVYVAMLIIIGPGLDLDAPR